MVLLRISTSFWRSSDLVPERLGDPFPRRDIVGHLGGADDLAGWRFDRRNRQRNIDPPAILGDTHRFKLLELRALADLPEELCGHHRGGRPGR